MEKPQPLRNVFALETHRYAPELNILHFYDGSTFPTPGITDIDLAYKHYKTCKQ